MNINSWDDPRSGWWGWHSKHERRAQHRFHHGMRRMRRGVLKFALLKLLSELPRHGYDLIREMREKGWAGGPGSIYPILAALEAGGLVTGHDEGGRRVYQITEQGRSLLGEHAAELERLLNDNDEEEEEMNDVGSQLRESAARLMQAISQLGPSSKPETIEHVRGLLDEARKAIYQALAEE